MKIYVVGSSKNNFLPLDDIREKFIVDEKHEGDNIDFLNPWYCELTGLYYLWKHVDDDIVGLEHYRRYFMTNDSQKGNFKTLPENEILNELKTADIICRKWNFKDHKEWQNGFSYWNRTNKKKYFDLFLNKISDKKFVEFIKSELTNQEYFAQCNMFIGKKIVINKYAEWLFNTLAELKPEEFKKSPRLQGYLAEFTFGAWLKYNGYKIKFKRSISLSKTMTDIWEDCKE